MQRKINFNNYKPIIQILNSFENFRTMQLIGSRNKMINYLSL